MTLHSSRRGLLINAMETSSTSTLFPYKYSQNHSYGVTYSLDTIQKPTHGYFHCIYKKAPSRRVQGHNHLGYFLQLTVTSRNNHKFGFFYTLKKIISKKRTISCKNPGVRINQFLMYSTTRDKSWRNCTPTPNLNMMSTNSQVSQTE